jgi:hypothetical protein
MNYLAVKDLKSPRKLRDRLERENELLLTNNGKPMALILHLAPTDDPEALLQASRDARSRIALSRIREAARRSGADHLDAPAIDRLIAKTRALRRSRP